MTYNDLLQKIIRKLGENYKQEDEEVLKDILTDIINKASFFSNREITIGSQDVKDDNLGILAPEISEMAIVAYQERGVEYTRSQSELGQSNTFIDVDETLRNNIVKNGKRVIF